MWTLTIARPVPSANDHVVNGRDVVAAAIYRRRRNEWAAALIYAANAQTGIAPWVGGYQPKRHVVITRIMGPRQRPYDDDNLRAGCKLIVDAMKPPRPARQTVFKGRIKLVKPVPGAALIVDDSPAWVSVEYRQEKGAAPGCRIEIEDV